MDWEDNSEEFEFFFRRNLEKEICNHVLEIVRIYFGLPFELNHGAIGKPHLSLRESRRSKAIIAIGVRGDKLDVEVYSHGCAAFITHMSLDDPNSLKPEGFKMVFEDIIRRLNTGQPPGLKKLVDVLRSGVQHWDLADVLNYSMDKWVPKTPRPVV